nr:MAG TPA: Vpu protein [Caudoviricetes sp.]
MYEKIQLVLSVTIIILFCTFWTIKFIKWKKSKKK